MPYSKNPHKYPPEMLQLLEYLRGRPPEAVRIGCQTLPEANSRKVMIQSFFRAVELHAEEQARLLANLRSKASTAAGRSDYAAADTTEEYRMAKAVAETWEDRAYVARQWMVKTDPNPPVVVVQRRGVDGTFGDSLRALLGGAQAQAPAQPATPAPDEFAEQMALLRQASAALQARGDKN